MSAHRGGGAALCCLLLILTTARPASADAPRVIRAATGPLMGPNSPWGEELLAFEAAVEAATGGQLAVQPQLDGALGDERRLMRHVQYGRLQMALLSTATLAAAMPELQGLALPFVFDSREQAARLLDEVFDSVGVALETQGLVLQRWEELGWEGLTLHAQEAPVYFLTWSYAGAQVKLGRPGVIDGLLSAGRIDGFADVPTIAEAGGWHQHITHYTITRQRYRSAAWVLNKAFVDKLPAALRDRLLEDRRGRFAASRKRVRQREEAALVAFRDRGVQLHELTAEERAGFAPLAKRIRERLLRRASPKSQSIIKAIDRIVSAPPGG